MLTIFTAEIGAWDHIDTTRVQPYHEMQVWDGVSGARISFDWAGSGAFPYFSSPPPSSGTIAFMIETLNLTSGLLNCLSSLGGTDLISSTKVEGIQLGEESEELDLRSWPIVNLSNGRSLAARLLIGADGINSPVRTFAGIQTRGWDYNRHGVVATLQLEGPGWGGNSHKTAYQRFLPTGPIAMLPLPGNMASLVWSTHPERAALLKSLSKDNFVSMVNAAFRLSTVDLDYLHTMSSGQADDVAWREQHTPNDAQSLPMRVSSVQEKSVASFPLRMRHADTYTTERVALVGDAAHTVHPLAGQGLNLGLGDSASLVKTISEAVSAGADIGSTISLEQYNQERYAENNAILGVCDKLHKLYSVESGPVVWGRTVGLNLVDKLWPVKDAIMKKAAGIS